SDPLFLRPGRASDLLSQRVLFHGRDVCVGGRVRRLRVDPVDELVERHAGVRGEVAPAERHARVEWRREQIRERDDDRVVVALLALDVEEALRASAAGLVHDDDRAGRELVLLGDAGDQARHLVGATAGPGGHDELDRLRRLPGGAGWRCRQDEDESESGLESHVPTPFGVRAVVLSVSLALAGKWNGPDPSGARPWFYETIDRAVIGLGT